MGAWVTLAATDLQARISAPEYAAFTSAAIAGGQSDPVPQLLAEVTNEVRGYITGCKSNQLGPDGTMPPELVDAAIKLVKLRLFQRVTSLKRFAEQAEPGAKDATRLLERVSDCKFSITLPDTFTADQSQGGGPVEVASRGCRRTKRCQLDGL